MHEALEALYINVRYFLPKLTDCPMYKTVNANATVIPIINHLLSIPCHDTLDRCHVEWVIERWG